MSVYIYYNKINMDSDRLYNFIETDTINTDDR